VTQLDIYPQFEETRETKNLKEIVSNRPAQEQRKLFHDNAMRFYQLA
jgi:predicted TIM-barrel fold metal-dependent hydrolase|tara:strand:+ start:983 stop:1123 length:141 start_codon:yes stop_codon:yes gene_type:complete